MLIFVDILLQSRYARLQPRLPVLFQFSFSLPHAFGGRGLQTGEYFLCLHLVLQLGNLRIPVRNLLFLFLYFPPEQLQHCLIVFAFSLHFLPQLLHIDYQHQLLLILFLR